MQPNIRKDPTANAKVKTCVRASGSYRPILKATAVVSSARPVRPAASRMAEATSAKPLKTLMRRKKIPPESSGLSCASVGRWTG
jgi:hypothetical protein